MEMLTSHATNDAAIGDGPDLPQATTRLGGAAAPDARPRVQAVPPKRASAPIALATGTGGAR